MIKTLSHAVLAFGFLLGVFVFVRTPVDELTFSGSRPKLVLTPVKPLTCQERARGVADNARKLSVDQQFSMSQEDYDRIYRNESAGCLEKPAVKF